MDSVAREGFREAASVTLARLALTDFRCYERAVMAVDPRPVVLTGPNGAGKTNLLEAISFLAPGRGLRQASLGAVDRRLPQANGTALPATSSGASQETQDSGADASVAWAVAARLAGPDGVTEIGTGRDPTTETGRERRLVKIDGTFVRGQAPLAARLGVVWLTPQMDRLFLEGASARRRFLDRLVYGLDPDHASRVSAYEHALRERARLLRAGPSIGSADDGPWLAALEEQIAARGVAIAAARRDFATRLDAAAADGVGPFPTAGLRVEGAIEAWLDEMPALAAEDRFRARLAESRARDAETGGAMLGPHRSDLQVTHLAKGMPAADCSTGEQKALLISIVLAVARLLTVARGAAPVLLLDEVAAHLDAVRRAALFEELLALGGQAWLTGTEEDLFCSLGDRAQFFRVRDAVITQR